MDSTPTTALVLYLVGMVLLGLLATLDRREPRG